VGKTALLDYLAEQALGCRVARVAGVEADLELAFAGVYQLCAPMLHCLERLPAPQRAALRTAFGLAPGPAPDRFLVALATLSLVSEAAEEQPLLCLVDDGQWLDRASAHVLGFVARRLAAEPVGLVFAARVPGGELAGLPELVVEGLQEADARALLDAVVAGPLDPGSVTGSSPRRMATRWRCWNCRGACRRRSWRAGSPSPTRCRSRSGSRRASGGGWTRSRPTPESCCWSRRPSRSVIRCWCGALPSGSGSGRRRRRRVPTPVCSSSAPGCGSGIRWCARRPTNRRRCSSGRTSTTPWRRPPTRSSIPTAVPGTAPRPRPGPTRTSPPSRFRVALDGQPPGAAHGTDVDDQGNGTLTEPRLYQLIRQPGPVTERTFEATFLDPGVQAYAFTFG
jgi:hypothetical protein